MKNFLLKGMLLLTASLFLFVAYGKNKNLNRNVLHANTTYTSTYNSVEYSSDRPYNLNVVYFLPNDVPLDPTYRKRLSALLLYGQNFYKQNMISNGYGAKTFGLFTETAHPDSVKIILIHGAHGIAYYPYGYHEPELQQVLDTFAANPSYEASEHTLILTAGPRREGINVPFYGIGKQCFALDYPSFDIQYLGSTDSTTFDIWFGGMLHELGHGLNLPHSYQTVTEGNDPTKGTNLMGPGNYTFGHAPTFINRAGSAILNNCQVFADVPNTYYDGHTAGLISLHAVFDNNELVVSGKFFSDKNVTDVNIYQDPRSGGTYFEGAGYNRPAWSVKPIGTDSFSVRMLASDLYNNNDKYILEVELLLENGETVLQYYTIKWVNGTPILDVNYDNASTDCGTVPSPWQMADIGTPTQPGEVCYTTADENFRIHSYGIRTSDDGDNFTYMYQMLHGDGTITARMKSLSNMPTSMGGLMLRNTLADNSAYQLINWNSDATVSDEWRTNDAGAANVGAPIGFPPASWLKIVRQGNSVRSYYSDDSLSWFPYSTHNLFLNMDIYVGIMAAGGNTFANTAHVTVSNGTAACNGGSAAGCPTVDTIAGQALEFTSTSKQDVTNTLLTVTPTNTYTITGWIKPKGLQQTEAPLLSWDQGYFYLGENNDNELRYTWNSSDVSNSFSSGLYAPADEWSFVAMVVHPDSVSFYLNNKMATDFTTPDVSDVTNTTIGSSPYSTPPYNGLMDEITVWKRALSTFEIDSLRNLTKEKLVGSGSPLYDASIIGYYQFNDPSTYKTVNLADSVEFTISNTVKKVLSTVPVGAGSSAKQTINAAGSYSFGSTGLTMTFKPTSNYPGGDVWVTKINQFPDSIPSGYTHVNGSYYIIHNQGANTTFDTPEMQFTNIDISTADAATPPVLKLLKRSSNEYLNNWGNPLCGANAAIAGSNGSVSFGNGCNNTSFSQFLIATTGSSALPVSLLSFTGIKQNNAALLQWKVTAEIDMSYYQVERSADGLNFTTTGTQKATRNSTYSLLDAQPLKGKNYYRLKMVNANGSFAYSDIITVFMNTSNFISILPNPVRHNQRMNIVNNGDSFADVYLYTADGKLFKHVVVAAHTKVSVTNLPQGILVYKATNANGNTASGIEVVQ